MSMQELIRRKRLGEELRQKEIRQIVRGYVRGAIPDSQIAALLMAIATQGFSDEETFWLTMEMMNSGRSLVPMTDWVDKHSTGGVGDKLSLVACPVAAAAGAKVAKLSGRGLGHTGGTLDKLESIPGLRTELSVDEFKEQVQTIGLAIAGQSREFVPADKRMYVLRGEVGLVDVPMLIAASVMSKKLAGGSMGIVLDVKAGRGGFCQTAEEARELARMMVDIGVRSGRKVVARITAMNQPLGMSAGNALEIREAIDVLSGQGPEDVRELAIVLAAEMICLSGVCRDLDEAVKIAVDKLDGGQALQVFGRMVEEQGGNGKVVEDLTVLPLAPVVREVPALRSGFVGMIDGLVIGKTCVVLGAGHDGRGLVVDPGAGVVLSRKVGDRVEKGDTLAFVHGRTEDIVDAGCRGVSNAVEICEEQSPASELLIDRIG